MTTHYDISVVRYDGFGTDAAVRVDVLQLQTGDPGVVAMNLRAMADRIDAEIAAPKPEPAPEAKPVRERKRRSDAGRPREARGSASTDVEPEPAPVATQPQSPFALA